MVYCGKPSKACGECRSRRTKVSQCINFLVLWKMLMASWLPKCDTKRPSCSQCVRLRRVCHGYRDPLDFIFRDEAEGLNAKHQRAKKAQAQKQHVMTSTPKSRPFDDTQTLAHTASNALRRLTRLSEIPIVCVISLSLDIARRTSYMLLLSELCAAAGQFPDWKFSLFVRYL